MNAKRYARLMPNDLPKYVRCYDNGGTEKNNGSIDRYTVVFTGNYKGREGCDYLAMNGAPFHPQGFGQHGWSRDVIDYPTYGHLGKKIHFTDLPEDCQIMALRDYLLTWGLATEDNYHHKASELVKARIAATAAVPV